MAIEVNIKTANGVVVSYHHIAAINVEINQRATIIVESYIDKEGRQYDKDYMAGRIIGDPSFPYTNMDYISVEWDEAEKLLIGDLIQNAYDWLKTQPSYTGAVDV